MLPVVCGKLFSFLLTLFTTFALLDTEKHLLSRKVHETIIWIEGIETSWASLTTPLVCQDRFPETEASPCLTSRYLLCPSYPELGQPKGNVPPQHRCGQHHRCSAEALLKPRKKVKGIISLLLPDLLRTERVGFA